MYKIAKTQYNIDNYVCRGLICANEWKKKNYWGGCYCNKQETNQWNNTQSCSETQHNDMSSRKQWAGGSAVRLKTRTRISSITLCVWVRERERERRYTISPPLRHTHTDLLMHVCVCVCVCLMMILPSPDLRSDLSVINTNNKSWTGLSFHLFSSVTLSTYEHEDGFLMQYAPVSVWFITNQFVWLRSDSLFKWESVMNSSVILTELFWALRCFV